MESKGNLIHVFNAFATSGEMDGRQFAKFAKDCKILDKKLTPTDIDLIFPKIKDKSARKVNFAQFEKGLHLCAEKKGTSFEELCDLCIESGGPKFTATKADAVKFHDDKSLYTGVHAKGGPVTFDTGAKEAHAPDISKSSVPLEEKKAAPTTKTMSTTHAAAASIQ